MSASHRSADGGPRSVQHTAPCGATASTAGSPPAMPEDATFDQSFGRRAATDAAPLCDSQWYRSPTSSGMAAPNPRAAFPRTPSLRRKSTYRNPQLARLKEEELWRPPEHCDAHTTQTFFQVGRDFESSRTSHAFTEKEFEKMGMFQSLDYYVEESSMYKQHIEHAPTRSFVVKWMMFSVVGLCVGFCSFIMFESISYAGRVRHDWTTDALKHSGGQRTFRAWALSVMPGTLLAIVASALVVFVAPAAAGGGVPDVMGYLNGVLVPHVFNIKTFIVKMLSAIAAVGSGLPVGPEGPIIHVGALVGAGLPKMRSRTFGIDWACSERIFGQFRNGKDHRDFISGGAAAGVSAAFSAPVGGLLFVFEEVASFWEPRLTWMVFFACVAAQFCNGVLRSAWKGWEWQGEFGYFAPRINIVFPVTVADNRLHALTMLLAVVIGLMGGLFGALFAFVNLKIVRMRNRRIAPRKWLRIVEPAVISIAFLSLKWWIGTAGDDCRSVPSGLQCDTDSAKESCDWLVDELCGDLTDKQDRQYTPIATLAFMSGDDVVKYMFTTWQDGISPGYRDLALYFMLYYVFACYSAGMAISSGIVIPMLVIGSTMGRFAGKAIGDIAGYQHNWVDPSIFALIGAAAFFAGVSRLTISLAVIMMEVSGNFDFLLPMMVSIVIAKWIADFFTHSLYHALLEVKCIPFIDFLCDIPKMDCFQAADIMAGPPHSPVITLHHRETVGHLLETLHDYDHNGFPVTQNVDGTPGDPSRPGRQVFMGIILRSQLATLLHMPDFWNSGPGSPTSSSRQMTWDLYQARVNQLKWMNVEIGEIATVDQGKFIDLTPHINTSSFSVPETCAVNLVRTLFRTMALRHLVVVNVSNEVVGMITRKDLIGQRIEQGMKRRMETAKAAIRRRNAIGNSSVQNDEA